ncbi:ribosomal protein S18 acetylase RimI-like enzyme [Marmoricola sp. URHA0025 HA25]
MVLIRPAEASEVPEVARVWRAGWLEAHTGRVPDALMAERTESYFTRTAEDLVDATLVAVDDDGGLLGVVLIHDDELFQLAVAPAVRGRGVGQALVSAAEERIGGEYDRAELAVVAANTPARRLYERCGWTDLGEVVHPARAADLDDDPIPVVVHHFVKELR